MKRNRWIIALLLLLLVIALYDHSGKKLFASLNLVPDSRSENDAVSALAAEHSFKPGTPAPAFTLTGLDGEEYGVNGKRDKPVLLNFWASWCDPCKQEAPELVDIADKYKDKLDVYSINVTKYDKLKEVEQFVDQYHFTFPVLLDKEEEVYLKYNGIAFPTNVLIDENGIVQDMMIGYLPPEELEAKLKKLIQE